MSPDTHTSETALDDWCDTCDSPTDFCDCGTLGDTAPDLDFLIDGQPLTHEARYD